MDTILLKGVRLTRQISTMVLLALLCTAGAFAQNGWLPPVSIPANTQLCDNEPYKLVFSDHFNGNSLNSQWIDFNSWPNMKYPAPNGIDSLFGDHENWERARGASDGTQGRAIVLPQNIEVSNGTLKLKLYHDSHTWQCASCNSSQAVSMNYTGASIAIPYIKIGTQWPVANWFNSGKFEARMKLPIAEHSYSTWWLWNGGGINEIDIAECVGDNNKFMRRNEINTHAFGPSSTQPNPYFLPQDASSGAIKYRSQNNWDIFWETPAYHKQQDWHTYTCEWDSTRIRFYIDGELAHTLYRFYTISQSQINGQVGNIKVGVGCTPSAGTYDINYGYPYNDASNSQLRLGITSNYAGSYTSGRSFIDQTEVDYIKVWQRHPERDGHTEVCKGDGMAISGPSLLCGGVTYTVPNPKPGGSWAILGNGFYIVPGTNMASSCVVNSLPSGSMTAILLYTYPSVDCVDPIVISSIILKSFAVSPYVQAVRSTYANGTQKFNLSTPALPGHTYQWQCNWNIPALSNGLGSLASGSFSGSGPNITSPALPLPSLRYTLQYTLTVTNSCGQFQYTGLKINWAGFRLKPETEKLEDHMLYSAEAMLTDVDSMRYEDAVVSELQSFVLPEEVTEEEVTEKYERIRFDQLFPYMVEEDMPGEGEPGGDIPDVGERPTAPIAQTADTARPMASRVFPNPSHGQITIRLAARFKEDEAVLLSIVDMTGRTIRQERMDAGARQKSLFTAGLPEATFVLILEQANHREILRFINLAK